MTLLSVLLAFSVAAKMVITIPLLDDLIIRLPQGKVRGAIYVTPNNKTYFGFRGIPYAAPPLDDLRFMAPQPAQPWSDIFDATEDGHTCLSSQNSVWGALESEDCLNLNVYTPSIKPTETLPVMVWIYGGAFNSGSSIKIMYGPDFLIEEDVIVVTFNYRLGPFGFLSTGDDVIPGNAGLKDQRTAIKWTHENIAYFGGNPNKIIIAGQSAGGSSVGLHIVSSRNAGLFTAAIAQSGNSITSFSINEDTRTYVNSLTTALGGAAYINDTQEIKQYLQGKTAVEINSAAYSGIEGTPSPVIEAQNDDPFLTESPYELLESGKFNQVPLMIGICANEGGLFVGDLKNEKDIAESYDASPDVLIPGNLHQNSSVNDIVAKAIYNMYVQHGETFSNNLAAVSSYITDNMVAKPTIKQSELSSKYVPVYLYQFAYYGRPFESLIEDGSEKAYHNAELPFIWNFRSISNTTLPADVLTQKRVVKLWTNFAKYLNPTPEETELINVTWPATNPTEFQFLNINNTLEVRSQLRKNYEEWNRIYQEYGRKPFITF